MKRISILFLLLVVILACNLPGATGSTPIAATESAEVIVPQNTLSLDETQFGQPPLNGVLPYGLGTGAPGFVTTEVEYPYINPGGGEMPAHTKFTISGYQFTGSMMTPAINVFIADEYAKYSELTAAEVAALKTPSAGLDELLPTGFYALNRAIQFKNGGGLRYLTQVFQAPAPVNNNGLFYYFQGLTSDGKYYISAVLPLSAPELLPADGDPSAVFPPQALPYDFSNFETHDLYIAAVRDQLNASAPDAFHPSLNDLDQLIESLQVAQ